MCGPGRSPASTRGGGDGTSERIQRTQVANIKILTAILQYECKTISGICPQSTVCTFSVNRDSAFAFWQATHQRVPCYINAPQCLIISRMCFDILDDTVPKTLELGACQTNRSVYDASFCGLTSFPRETLCILHPPQEFIRSYVCSLIRTVPPRRLVLVGASRSGRIRCLTCVALWGRVGPIVVFRRCLDVCWQGIIRR